MAIRVRTNVNFKRKDYAFSVMIGHPITLAIAFIITFHGQICKANLPTFKCDRSFNYTNGSQFESNMNTVFGMLAQRTIQTGFNISVHGKSPDQVYGLLQCREDKTTDQCYSCLQFARKTIRVTCGNAVGGSIWPWECFLRYENYSFIGQENPTIAYNYPVGNIPNPDDEAVQNLLNQLSDKAAVRTKRSALGTAVDSLSRNIYGLVQCTRDLSTDNCAKCLSDAINSIFIEHPGQKGVQLWGQSCNVRYETYEFFNSTALPPPPAETPSVQTPSMSSGDKSSNKTPIILSVVGGLVLFLIVCLFATRRRLKSAIFLKGYEVHGQVEEDTPISNDVQIAFTMETLLAATENFHDDNKLGEGGFGPVYKGTTRDGKEMAVKKLSLKSMQGQREFLNEVKLVAKVQHRNLVNLLGCCAEGSERFLVYEYLPNKSLDKILFDPNKRIQLDWQKRYNIILGVARGLLYLHQDSQLRIIHRDIKASNILLDENLNPKIADFGLARLFPESDETHVSTTQVAGTYGYMSPEYALHGQLSVKADVYSFGVVLLEIIAGRKNADYTLSPETQRLLAWAWRLYEGGNSEQIIDRAIIETCDEETALRCIYVGLLCTQTDSSLRPAMSRVTMMLSTDSVTTLQDPTKPPVFELSAVSQNTESSTNSGSGLSHASATRSSPSSITELVPT